MASQETVSVACVGGFQSQHYRSVPARPVYDDEYEMGEKVGLKKEGEKDVMK